MLIHGGFYLGISENIVQDTTAKQVISEFILEYVDERFKEGALEVVVDDIFTASKVNGLIVWNRKGFPTSLEHVVTHVYTEER